MSTYAGEATDLEGRFDLASLEGLQHQRRQLLAKHARLVALHGPFGHYDDHRKRMVEALKIGARSELSKATDKKPTEDMVTAVAYGSDAYQAFLDTALSEKIEYLGVQADLDEIRERIESRIAEMYLVGKEAGLQR